MKIAIIGSGISGMTAAWKLYKDHEITVFEANKHVGGHTHTHDVTLGDRHWAVDTGFIVFNDWTYPNFIALLDELGVESQPSCMGFSVKCEKSGLEYNGHTLNTLFAQRSNLLRPSFHRMIRDILRFNREAPTLLESDDHDTTLGEYLERNHYSRQFIEHYIVPMGSAIWSAVPEMMYRFPVYFFVRFFRNHGMLSINDRPQWRVIRGGSREYMTKMVAPFRDRVRLNTPVAMIRRTPTHVLVKPVGGEAELFDQVFIASHSDQALRLLVDASPFEREILGAIPYQHNRAVLHTDSHLMPKRRRAWAAWNYHIRPDADDRPAALTYNMNILQTLDAPEPFLVTLNYEEAIDPAKVIATVDYDHPVFTGPGAVAQTRQELINGANRTYFVGAYWRNGFHEDGVVSALNALDHFTARQRDEERDLRRTG
jgi:predicted NAD/FAD-binding protein